MLMLAAELGNENGVIHIRNAAGIAIKNALTARVRNISSELPLYL